ncbi:MAG: methyltransferase domain-containing protein, partial [Pseudomonadota bacterium]
MCRRVIGIVIDRNYDRQHGVDTSGFIPAKFLAPDSASSQFSHEYGPTPQKSFRRMLDVLPCSFKDYTLVDYGSGKGRTLLIAAEYPFKQIIGIEYSEELVKIADKNVATYRGQPLQCTSIESKFMDATVYSPPLT